MGYRTKRNHAQYGEYLLRLEEVVYSRQGLPLLPGILRPGGKEERGSGCSASLDVIQKKWLEIEIGGGIEFELDRKSGIIRNVF